MRETSGCRLRKTLIQRPGSSILGYWECHSRCQKSKGYQHITVVESEVIFSLLLDKFRFRSLPDRHVFWLHKVNSLTSRHVNFKVVMPGRKAVERLAEKLLVVRNGMSLFMTFRFAAGLNAATNRKLKVEPAIAGHCTPNIRHAVDDVFVTLKGAPGPERDHVPIGVVFPLEQFENGIYLWN